MKMIGREKNLYEARELEDEPSKNTVMKHFSFICVVIQMYSRLTEKENDINNASSTKSSCR